MPPAVARHVHVVGQGTVEPQLNVHGIHPAQNTRVEHVVINGSAVVVLALRLVSLGKPPSNREYLKKGNLITFNNNKAVTWNKLIILSHISWLSGPVPMLAMVSTLPLNFIVGVCSGCKYTLLRAPQHRHLGPYPSTGPSLRRSSVDRPRLH